MILQEINNVSKNIKWSEIEKFYNTNNFNIKRSKKGYKVYIKHSVWSVHIEHRTSEKLKYGIIRELKKILIKEKLL